MLSLPCAGTNPPLWVLGGGGKEVGWSQVLLSQLCFTWPECVSLQWRTSLLMSRDGRGLPLVVKVELAEELRMPVGLKPLHPSSEGRSLQTVVLDCSFHIYNLHQKNGFTCMLIGEIFELM